MTLLSMYIVYIVFMVTLHPHMHPYRNHNHLKTLALMFKVKLKWN